MKGFSNQLIEKHRFLKQLDESSKSRGDIEKAKSEFDGLISFEQFLNVAGLESPLIEVSQYWKHTSNLHTHIHTHTLHTLWDASVCMPYVMLSFLSLCWSLSECRFQLIISLHILFCQSRSMKLYLA